MLWVLASVVQTGYALGYDIHMDWGLARGSAVRRGLRDNIIYPEAGTRVCLGCSVEGIPFLWRNEQAGRLACSCDRPDIILRIGKKNIVTETFFSVA